MSQPRATSTKPTRVQPNADRYTILLIIAFLAMVIGCVLLYLELGEQGLGAFGRILLPQSEFATNAVTTAFRFFA